MNRSIQAYFLAVISLVVSSELAMSQEKGQEAMRDYDIAHLAGIEDVQKDLGVSDDVARQLTLLHEDERAAMRKVFDEQKSESALKLQAGFASKAMELLSADQKI